MLRKIVFGFLWFIAFNILAGISIGALAGAIAGSGQADPQNAYEAGKAAGASLAWLKPYVLVVSAIVCCLGAVMGFLPSGCSLET